MKKKLVIPIVGGVIVLLVLAILISLLVMHANRLPQNFTSERFLYASSLDTNKVYYFSLEEYQSYLKIAQTKEFEDLIAKIGINRIQGPIPDAKTAVQVAKSVWLQAFGEEINRYDKIYVSYDPQNSVWKISGFDDFAESFAGTGIIPIDDRAPMIILQKKMAKFSLW